MSAFALLLLLLPFAQPFWETTPPAKWTEEQLSVMLTDSPWARPDAFLATAAPMLAAEQQWRVRHIPKQAGDGGDSDYTLFLQENAATHLALAVRIQFPNELSKSEEIERMEKECFLRAGRSKIRLAGHFPPTSADPFLRLVFPRPPAAFRSLEFDLYLPGVSMAYRALEFSAKEMIWRGKLEY